MAEVKVKITASNETQTGLQSVLSDAQKTASQVQQTFARATAPQPAAKSFAAPDIGDYGLEPLRDLQRQLREARELAQQPIELAAPNAGQGFAKANQGVASAIRGLAIDLATASSPAQIFEAIIRRISTAMGGLIAATAGFAIGSLIRKSLEDAARGLDEIIDRSQALQSSFSKLSAPTTTFDQLAASIKGAASQFEGLQKANEDYKASASNKFADFFTQKGNIGETAANALVPGGAVAARLLARLRGDQGSLFDTSDQEALAGIANSRAALANAIGEATNRELTLAKARTDEERKLIALQATRNELINAAKEADRAGGGAPRGGRTSVEDRTKRLLDAQDARLAAEQSAQFGKQAADIRQKNAEGGMSSEQRLAKEQAALARLDAEAQKSGRYTNKAQVEREETVARIASLEKQIASDQEKAALTAERAAENKKRKDEAAAEAEKRKTERRQDFNQNTDLMEARAAGDKKREEEILRQQDYEKAFEATNSVEDAMRYADAAAQLRAQSAGQQMTGSFGASSLQRIGFASNEYFDTRRKEDTGKQIERMVIEQKRTNQILGDGKTLVMQSDF